MQRSEEADLIEEERMLDDITSYDFSKSHEHDNSKFPSPFENL